MKTTLLITFGAVALAAVGCASQTEETEKTSQTQQTDDAEGTGEATGQRSDALRNTGGGQLADRDTCEAWKAGCYMSCAKSNDSSCYRFCDIQYAQCRGLPPPELAIF